jgi:hypothetical protein
MTTHMPKKVRQHFLKFLGLTGGYFIIEDGLARVHLLMSLVALSDNFEKIGYAVTAIYLATGIWFGWRLYTGVRRDGDFLD